MIMLGNYFLDIQYDHKIYIFKSINMILLWLLFIILNKTNIGIKLLYYKINWTFNKSNTNIFIAHFKNTILTFMSQFLNFQSLICQHVFYMHCIFCNIEFILLFHAALKLTQILITETELKFSLHQNYLK